MSYIITKEAEAFIKGHEDLNTHIRIASNKIDHNNPWIYYNLHYVSRSNPSKTDWFNMNGPKYKYKYDYEANGLGLTNDDDENYCEIIEYNVNKIYVIPKDKIKKKYKKGKTKKYKKYQIIIENAYRKKNSDYINYSKQRRITDFIKKKE